MNKLSALKKANSIKSVIMPCLIFNGEPVKISERGTNVSIVINLLGKKFEAATKKLHKPLCKHEVEGMTGICYKKEQYGQPCATYFCSKYEDTPVPVSR